MAVVEFGLFVSGQLGRCCGAACTALELWMCRAESIVVKGVKTARFLLRNSIKNHSFYRKHLKE